MHSIGSISARRHSMIRPASSGSCAAGGQVGDVGRHEVAAAARRRAARTRTRHGGEHAALVGDRLGHHDVERGDAVGRDHQQPAVAGVVDVADLAGVEVRQVERRSRGPVDSQDRLRVVARRPRGGGRRRRRRRWSDERRRPARRRRAGERQRLGDQRVELRRGRGGRRASAAEAVEQVVAGAALLPHASATATACSLIDLVGLLPADARPHRGQQHLGGGEERQVAVAARGR